MTSVIRRTIQVDGADLHAVIEANGDRPWLTMLHALATDHRMWDAEAAAFARTHKILRLDMRGHGASTASPPPYDLAGLVRDVVSSWDTLGIAWSDVMGLSIGGMLALGLALDHPARVGRIVAANCRADAPVWFRTMFDSRRQAVLIGGMQAVVDTTLGTWLTETTREARPEVEIAARAMILGTSRNGYLGATAALQSLTLLPRLGSIAAPIQLIVGAQDGRHPAAMAEMAAAIPDARLHSLAGAAHLSNLDQPAAFLASAAQFLCGSGQ